jgi:hypothetical protein
MPIEDKLQIDPEMKRTTVYVDENKHNQLRVYLMSLKPPMSFSEWVCRMINRQIVLINEEQLKSLKEEIKKI